MTTVKNSPLPETLPPEKQEIFRDYKNNEATLKNLDKEDIYILLRKM
jgi:hypothetical protein